MASHPMMFIDGTLVPEDASQAPATRSRRSGADAGGAAPSSGGKQSSGRKERARNWEGSSSEDEEAEEEEGGAEGDDEDQAAGEAGLGEATKSGRARREGKARVIYVNGQPVLKENM